MFAFISYLAAAADAQAQFLAMQPYFHEKPELVRRTPEAVLSGREKLLNAV